jgi:23S rRNA (cytosine1962-C5)-methyltransferase
VERWLGTIRDELPDIPSGYVKIRPHHASRLTEAERDELAPSEPLWGPSVDEVSVAEAGASYLVRPAAGLSVGLFLDMRDVRTWLCANVRGRTVLNLFAYTCSLGVSASRGGATRVLNLDLSRRYLEWGKANYALNHLEVDPHDFVYGDAFDWLTRFERRKQRFDVVIVDPPSFSSTPFSVQRDYPRLVRGAAQAVASAGILVAATNHTGTSDEHFDAWLRDGLRMAGRHGHLVHSWHEPSADFPVAPGGMPYLKVRAHVLD